MTATVILQEISAAALVIILAGVIFRVVFCLTKMINNDDEYEVYKKKMIHAIWFGVLAICLPSVKNIILRYFGG